VSHKVRAPIYVTVAGMTTTHVTMLDGSTSFEVGASHADEARHFADEAETDTAALHELYGEDRRDSNRIAQVHQHLRTSLKLAEVHGLLAIADEMRLLREELTA
jgi:hypothetical protein